MAEYKYKKIGNVIWGRMPDGTAQKFKTVKDYNEAYYTALDEIIDQIAELHKRMEMEYPEDYNFIVA